MVSSIGNVKLGSSLLTYNSTDLGWTDENGVTIEMPGHTYTPLTVDQYGVYPLSKFDVGIEAFKVKFNLYEQTQENRVLLMPLATEVDSNKLTEGSLPGTEMSSLHGALNVHPRRLLTANKSLDLDIHAILLEWKGEYKLGVADVQMLVVEGDAIIDTSRTVTDMLYSFGGASS